MRRRPRHPFARRAAFVLATVVLAAVALMAFMDARATGPTTVKLPPRPRAAPPRPPVSTYATQPVAPPERVDFKPHIPLRAGLLFDVATGKVLWEQGASNALPIASLTKMMTALVVVQHAPPDAPVLITPDAVHFSGSGVGMLPLGKHVPLEALLYGLLLPSGNDAAIALAEHVAGTQARFIAMMNAQAARMGLRCTHFDTVSGIVDRGNYSCATDLAAIAHALLLQPRLAAIVASRSATLPFPIKGGKLYLYNNNPLLLARYPGADGVKTGYTQAAGACLVATARRGHAWLGVVLLHSNNPAVQAQNLLNSGFAGQTAH
jgi:serine-type D-Ala-D-Ala carboxypeptidase (penicillin-binding protein 5/6)